MRLNSSVGIKLGLLASVLLAVVFVATALWVDAFMHRNLEQLLFQQARTLVKEIVLLRHWNSSFGGVYVRKLPGTETNRYLYLVGPGDGKQSAVVPEIKDLQGNVYTLKNPALMARELSELTEKNSDIRFHLTSLNPVNPGNAPDEFEARALKRFDAGVKETAEFSNIKDKPYYRYMAPLYVEQSCLRCHGFQDYKVGDIRGGISLSLAVEDEHHVFMDSRDRFVVFAGLLSVLMVFTIIYGSYFIVTRPLRIMGRYASNMGQHQRLPDNLTGRHDEIGLLALELTGTNAELLAQRERIIEHTMQLEHDSRTDALTGLYNRRYLFTEGVRLYERWQHGHAKIAILMIDIDYFKRINDQYGHQVGDEVLVEVAQRLQQQCRPYDLVARYGGEEFVVLLEAPTSGSGESTAKRIHQSIRDNAIKIASGEIYVTISIGVIEGHEIGDFDTALRKADEALYRAKDSGRNRIVASVEA